MRLLLEACTETLEILKLDPTDPRGEQPCLNCVHAQANDFVARSSLRDSNRSRNKSFRTLHLPASSITHKPTHGSPDATTFIKHVLSTITSSEPTEIIVYYSGGDFRGIEREHPGWPSLRELSRAAVESEASWHRRRFKVLREVRKVRNFRLVLCAAAPGCIGEYPVQLLDKVVAEEKGKGGFDDFSCEPFVAYRPVSVSQFC